MALRILTDSSADMEPEEFMARDVICVPLSVTFGDEIFHDGFEISKDEFYRLLVTRDVHPQTSQPSPEEFLREFLKAKEAGDDIIAIVLASGLSGTIQSATIAKDMADYDRITVVDSLTVATGLRMLLDIAVGMRDDGASAEDIAAMVKQVQPRIRIYAVVDTLEYLYRGGRLNKATATVGGLVNVKPLICVENEAGKVNLIGIGVGKERAAKKLVSIIEADEKDPAFPIYFPYSHDRKNVDALIETLDPEHKYLDNKHCYNLGPTIGTHIGAAAFGITYVVKE